MGGHRIVKHSKRGYGNQKAAGFMKRIVVDSEREIGLRLLHNFLFS